ncbi:MAG: hypothetical protein M0R80_02575 [Proteobacteria bacterium]|jgi:hypothetical protein|nr:hypothetical protein [Pseudomonadota bacterium]
MEKSKKACEAVGVIAVLAIGLDILPALFSAMLLDSPYADWTAYLAVDCILLWIPAWIIAWILSLIGAYRGSLRWLWGLILPAACLAGFILAFSCGK